MDDLPYWADALPYWAGSIKQRVDLLELDRPRARLLLALPPGALEALVAGLEARLGMDLLDRLVLIAPLVLGRARWPVDGLRRRAATEERLVVVVCNGM